MVSLPAAPVLSASVLRGPVAARRALAGARDLAPEALMLLALDSDPAVREAVAANPRAPAHADRILVTAAEMEIRVALAGKLGPRAAEVAQGDRRGERLWREALRLLASDVEARVRATLADALADLPDAPRDLVLALARDAALEVCEPLIRLSRALREEDLLALVEAPPGPFTRRAVAGRLHLEEAPCRALARCGEAEWRVLLANHTARIPPETLTVLASHARSLPWLPEMLAGRPGLSEDLLREVLPLLARDARNRLLGRRDLPPPLRDALAGSGRRPVSWQG